MSESEEADDEEEVECSVLTNKTVGKKRVKNIPKWKILESEKYNIGEESNKRQKAN